MDKTTLRKVQLVQLEIAKEVKRVCEKHNIRYFLTAGTLLGAVRHKGFIPWDDDLDMVMLREDYDKFLKIAPLELRPEYEIQNWHDDSKCPYEYSKIRKKGTVFVEGKGNPEKERGIYIDLFVFIHLPDDEEEIRQVTSQLVDLHRTLLMKCGFRPWYNDGKILWKKRIGYILYQLKALAKSYQKLVDEYEKCILRYPNSCNKMNEQILSLNFPVIQKKWYQSSVMVQFEDDVFPAPVDYEKYLIENYGDYMQLPPVNERENRHQVLRISFGD